MKINCDVAIIGAGSSGTSIARELCRYRLKVLLIEKEADASFGVSKANSGIIHAGFHSRKGSLKAELCVKGCRMYPQLSEELEFEYKQCGALVAAFDFEELQTLQKLYYSGLENGVEGLELIDKNRALELEPFLNPDIFAALYSPTTGITGPYEYCFAMLENALANGLEVLFSEAVEWINRDSRGRYLIETDKGTRIETDWIVNAAGLNADTVARLAGAGDFVIKPRKGEEYLLDKRVGSLVSRVIYPVPSPSSKGMLVIPTVDGPVMVGPTAVEAESREDTSTSTPGLKSVFLHAQKMIPAIRVNDVITSFTGIRPASGSSDFILGVSSAERFVNAAGIESPGLTAAPAIAVYIAESMKQAGLVTDKKKDFTAARKKTKSSRRLIAEGKIEELNRLAAEDPAWTKLVCRCEAVSEKEIIEAVRAGHTTLDGIKFSTRALSGRCQGGFCTARIIRILTEHGIKPEEISKKGKGSELIKCRMEDRQE